MNFELSDEDRMLKELVAKFVRDELLPLEGKVLERDAAGQGAMLLPEEKTRIDQVSRDLGLWGLDAPENVGGSNLSHVSMVGVNEEMGKTITPYVLPPDSPNE